MSTIIVVWSGLLTINDMKNDYPLRLSLFGFGTDRANHASTDSSDHFCHLKQNRYFQKSIIKPIYLLLDIFGSFWKNIDIISVDASHALAEVARDLRKIYLQSVDTRSNRCFTSTCFMAFQLIVLPQPCLLVLPAPAPLSTLLSPDLTMLKSSSTSLVLNCYI